MRWTSRGIAGLFGLFLLPANIQPAAAQQRDNSQARRAQAAYQERDLPTNTAFSAAMDDRGDAVVTARTEGFRLEKAVAPSGETTIRLIQGQDIVSIALNRSGYEVSRGTKTARLDVRSGTQEDLDTVRGVLLGSPAVRAFRRLSASLENRDANDDEGPLFLSTLVDGAIVGMLDGDSGAIDRIGRRITRHQRASLRQAKLDTEPFKDCVLLYEMSLLQAWDLFFACTQAAVNSPWYLFYGAETMCEFEFLLRSQQYMYQFLSCFAYPF